MAMKDDEVDWKITKVSDSCARLRKEERRYKAWLDGLSEASRQILADEVLEWGSRLQRERAVVSQERMELLVLLTEHFADSQGDKSESKPDAGSDFQAADDSLSEGEKKKGQGGSGSTSLSGVVHGGIESEQRDKKEGENKGLKEASLSDLEDLSEGEGDIGNESDPEGYTL